MTSNDICYCALCKLFTHYKLLKFRLVTSLLITISVASSELAFVIILLLKYTRVTQTTTIKSHSCSTYFLVNIICRFEAIKFVLYIQLPTTKAQYKLLF